MKKLFTLFAALLLTTTIYAQVFTLEKTLEGMFLANSVEYTDNGDFVKQTPLLQFAASGLPAGALYNTSFTADSYTIKAYDSKYNLIRNKTVTFSLPSGYKIQSGYHTTQLNKAGDDYYFLTLVMENSPSGVDGYSKLVLFDQNGRSVQELASADLMVSPYNYLYGIDGFYKMIVHTYSLRGDNKTLVFHLNSKPGPSYIRLMEMTSSTPTAYKLDGTPAAATQSGMQILLNERGEAVKILKH